jgi:hypothetical protein
MPPLDQLVGRLGAMQTGISSGLIASLCRRSPCFTAGNGQTAFIYRVNVYSEAIGPRRFNIVLPEELLRARLKHWH